MTVFTAPALVLLAYYCAKGRALSASAVIAFAKGLHTEDSPGCDENELRLAITHLVSGGLLVTVLATDKSLQSEPLYALTEHGLKKARKAAAPVKALCPLLL